MANGICVFAENYNGNLEPVVAELVRAAHCIKETTGEKIQAAVLAEDCKALVAQLEQLGFDEIYAVETDRNCLFQDDAVSQAMAEMLKRIDPSSVLIPATPTGRSVFSRVAARLGCGMTADCTELAVDTREDGTFFIKQNKPSFGENVFVTIVTKEGVYPQMMTVRPGVYTPCEAQEGRRADVTYYKDITLPESGIQVMSSAPAMNDTDSILAAEVALVGHAASANLGVILIAFIRIEVPVVLVADAHCVDVCVKADEGLAGSHISQNIAHGVDVYLVKSQLCHLFSDTVDVSLLITALAREFNDVA